ncbi:protein kinase [Gemmata sp. G18]|uniref:Protein kinase n=1 Tax=Gemmata palustris TaxID=2822762 RepID=A0ABS5BRK9_9BACT|nr:protein kinase [Gemmata palustris]MBP3956318.1 protein kinase [Gemmata palustris]
MSEPAIPTEEEIATLPRWARVALAARCARRVLPLYQHFWLAAPVEYVAAVARAIEVAECAAAFRLEIDDGAEAGAQAAVGPAADFLPAYYVAEAAAYAACAAFTPNAYFVARAAVAADDAVDAAYPVGGASILRRAVCVDLELLTSAVLSRRCSDETPIAPTFFGPLWPDSPPLGWPAEDAPSEPTNPQDDAQTIVPSPSQARRMREFAMGGPVLVPGTRVPHAEMWILVELIGKGGFAQVWLARHHQSKAFRAVKFCTHAVARERLPDVARHESNVASYVQQHTSTPAGCHPNIVPLYECNLKGETPWLMYEFVPGKRSVANVIEDLQVLPVADRVARAVSLLHTIACAVGQFHRLERQIVHRDLTPKNVLMHGDVPRITDFGIGGAAVTAAVADATGHTEFTVRVDTMLRSAGTPPHASVQQLAGNDPDPRDDVYALGVMTYQMLTGDLGAPGADARDKLEEMGVPVELIRLIVKSVSDLSRRPKDAVEWAEMLAPLLPDRPAISPLLKRNVTVPGAWFSRLAGDSSVKWERVGHSPCEITFAPDRRYRLNVSNQVADVDLEGFRALADVPFLSVLTISMCPVVTSIGLTYLSGLTALTYLELRYCKGVTDLTPLSSLATLTNLDLSFCDGVTDLTPLSGLAALTNLELRYCKGLADLSPLSDLAALTNLDLSSCDSVTDLTPLSDLSTLKNLALRFCTGVTDLSPLSGLAALTTLDLSGCARKLVIPDKLRKRVKIVR